jgi:hypothetical protein
LWRAASAVSVVDAALGQPFDLAGLRRAYTQEGLEDGDCLVALPALICVDPRTGTKGLTQLQSWLQRIDLDSSRAIVQSAMAGARQRLGDAGGAEAAAKIALHASAEGQPDKVAARARCRVEGVSSR